MPETPDPRPPSVPEARIVLLAKGREYTVADVIRAAHFRGDLDESWSSLLSKLACLQHAEAEGLEPGGDDLQSIADAFRYERDLITSEETEAWLSTRGLDEATFSAHVLRTYWRNELRDRIAASPEELDLSSQAAAGLTIQLILSGLLEHLTRDFAHRLASLQTTDAGAEALPPQIELERERFFERTGLTTATLSGWLLSTSADETWWNQMLSLEAAYHLHKVHVVTPEKLTRALRTRRLGLMRFETEEIEFDSLEAAREAVLCVRQDNLSMEEVAAESGYSYRPSEFLLEEQPNAWQTALLSTPEGGLAAPIDDGEVVRLFRVMRKVEPTIDDPEVRAHLEEHLIAAAFEELCIAQGFKFLD